MSHVLVVRLDSLGDMLICGPAIRAIAAGGDRVTVLAGPTGAAAARLLPGVSDVVVWACPWIELSAGPVSGPDIDALVARLARLDLDRAVILTSFHQSALPTALVLRLAGVPFIAAVSEDFPGALLDLRLAPPPELPEPERMLAIARACGYDLEPGDRGGLAVRLPATPADAPTGDYVVVHPGASAPARSYPAALWAQVVQRLTAAGRQVIVTGAGAETELVAIVAAGATSPGAVAAGTVVEAAGRWNVGELAAVLAGAGALAVANTGPAHLAAAVGTPVVSLFAPVVPATRWAPYAVETVLLGDQDAACRDSRARDCPVPGHPCLSSVWPESVADAVALLAGPVRPLAAAATATAAAPTALPAEAPR